MEGLLLGMWGYGGPFVTSMFCHEEPCIHSGGSPWCVRVVHDGTITERLVGIPTDTY